MHGIGYRLYGITVVEKGSRITISNLPHHFTTMLSADMNRAFSTSKIETYMFITYGKSFIELDRFFGPDLLFVLETIKTIKYRRSNIGMINKLIDLLKTNTWMVSIEQAEPLTFNDKRLKDFVFDPLPHQAEFFKIYCKKVPSLLLRGYLLAADPGTGKTYTSLALMRCRNDLPTVIFSPKVAIYTVWEHNLKEFTRYNPTYWISDRDSNKGLVKSDYYIFHYEDLGLAMQYAEQLKGFNVIVDESHNFTDLDAKRTQQLVDYCLQCDSNDILFMSGTPLKAIGTDAIPIFRSIDPLFTESVAARFKALYGRSVSRAVAVLANRIGEIMFKAKKLTKDPIRIDIPVKTPDGETYTLDNIRNELRIFVKERAIYYRENRKHFHDVYDESIAFVKPFLHYVSAIISHYDPASMRDQVKFCNIYEKSIIAPLLPPNLRTEFLNARSVVKYVELKIQGEALARVVGKRREECTVSLIPHIGMEAIVANAEAKTVVFTSYVEALVVAEKYFKAKGFKPKVVYGDTNKDLAEIIKSFDKDGDVNPLIATFKSLSTATPLTMANTLILLDQPFRPYILEQTIARVDRLNQDKNVYVNNVLLDTDGADNISTRSRDIMLIAKEMVDAIMGIKSIPLQESFEEFGIGIETMDDVEYDTTDTPPSLTW